MGIIRVYVLGFFVYCKLDKEVIFFFCYRDDSYNC